MGTDRPSLATVVAGRVAEHLKIDPVIAERALRLLGEGMPIPYLARYRRMDVGGLDETTLHDIRNEAEHWRELEQRREFVLRVLNDRDDVPGKVRKRIENARSRPEIEYVYEAGGKKGRRDP